MNLKGYLRQQNTWWSTGSVDADLLFKRIRSEFSGILKNVQKDILLLCGPYGCGKTTLLHQTIDYLLKLKTPPARILLLRGDDPALAAAGAGLSEILRFYSEQILGEDLLSAGAPVYLFLDEAQKFGDLHKAVSPLLGSRVKLFLSSPFDDLPATDGQKTESAVIRVPPLSPQQFIEFCSTYREREFDNIRFRSLMPRLSLFENPKEYAEVLESNFPGLAAFRAQKTGMLREYMLAGGYPGYFGCPDMKAWHRKLLGEVIDLSLFSDILSGANLKSPEKLKTLLCLIADESGSDLSFAGLGGRLKLNTVTAINHVGLLSRGGLVTVCENYTRNQNGVMRKNKRLYLRDSGMKHALLHRPSPDDGDLRGEMEGVLLKLASDYIDGERGRVCYWKSGRNSADFIVDKSYEQLPVNLLCTDDVPKRMLRGLSTFARSNFNRQAVVITSSTLKTKDGVCYIPYWLI